MGFGVSANNLKTIKVTFNKEVDKASVNATNLRVYDGANQVSGLTVSLAEDNKTAYIVNSGTFTQLKEYKVVAENVVDKADSTVKLAKSETPVTIVDTTLPTVEGVTVKSPKTLEIQFSEPGINFPTIAQVTDKVKIDGINAYLSHVDPAKLNTEGKVTITLGTALTVGEHKVKISGLADAANLPVAEKEFTVNVEADTTVPTIESVSATSKDKVTVKFNKPVDASTVTASTVKIYEASTQKTFATPAYTTEDNQTFVFNLAGGQELGIASLVDASVKIKGVKDAYGNEVKEEQTFAFTATDDKVAPTVSNIKVNNDNTIEVTFSEDVTFTNAGIELLDKDNKKLTNTISVAQKTVDGKPSKKVYTVTVTGGSNLSGAHSLKFVKDVTKDLSVRGNALAETTQAISFNDKVAPKYTSAVFVNESGTNDFNLDGDVLDSKVTIYFNEAMDPATLTNTANYLLAGQPLADIKGASLSAASDNKSVTITINRTAPDTQFVFTANTNNDLKIIAVKDAAGNTLDSTQVNQAITLTQFVANDALTNIIDNAKVEVIAKNQIKVYTKAGITLESIDPNKVKFAKGGAVHNNLQVTGVTLSEDKKSAVLNLNNNLSADAKVEGAALTVYADADAFVTTTGVKSQALAIASGLTVVDKVRATVQPVDGKFEVAGDTVTVKFDENLGTVAAEALVVKDSQGNQLVPTTDYTATKANGNEIAIKIVKPGFNDKVTVALSNNVTITDDSNPANFVNNFAAIESKDAIATAVGVTLGNTTETTKGVAAVAPVKGKSTAKNAYTTNANFTGLTAAEIKITVGGTIYTADNATIAGLGNLADVGAGKTYADTATVEAAIINVVKAAANGGAALSTVADVEIVDGKIVITAQTAATGTNVSVAVTAGTAGSGGSTAAALGFVNNDNTNVLGVTEVAAVPEVGTTPVTAGASNNGTIKVKVAEGATTVKEVQVSVANGDTKAQVAAKIVAALNANADVSAKYAVTQGGAGNEDKVILTQKAPNSDVALAVTLVTP